MPNTSAYAAFASDKPLAPFQFDRRALTQTDVRIEILFCGVCHSDIHQVRSEWRESPYPLVPGHEIIGRVTEIGAQVKKYKVGELVGVGCLVDSCRTCPDCKAGLEQFCHTGPVFTYGGIDKKHNNELTQGGYSTQIVTDESFVLRISESLDPAAAAPLLCAGITTYSPLKHWKVGPGQRVGIIGLGGLGHMGVKLAKAFGAHVVLFTTSANKIEDAKRLGADEVVLSKNADEMSKQARSLNFILDTVSALHDLNDYLPLLKRDGTLCLVGVPAESLPSPEAFNLIGGRRSLAGSLIGGIQETQDMLDFCAAHKIVSDIEIIPIQKINEAYERMLKQDVKYRFVIDMGSMRDSSSSV